MNFDIQINPNIAYWRYDPLTLAMKLTEGSEKQIKAYRFHRYLADKLIESLFKPSSRLIISAPPQHGKTETLFWFVAWFLEMMPHKSVIWTSYDDDLAKKNGSKMRDLFLYNNELLKTKIKSSKRSDSYWETIEGGEQRFTSMGGGITGLGGDLIIIDDPVKSGSEYDNPRTLKKQINWMREVIYTRTRGHAPIILVQTRWRDMDLAGYLLAESKYEWEYIKIKAIAEENDILGRQVGEPLCEELQPITSLKMKRLELQNTFAAMYQGDPIPESGGIWAKHYWRRWDQSMFPPRWNEKIISVDATFDDTDYADDCAIQVWGRYKNDLFLLDALAEKMDFEETIFHLENFLKRHKDTRTIIIEKKANGPAIRSILKKKFNNIVQIEPLGSKRERAEACKPFLKMGQIFIPKEESTPWDAKFFEQVTRFPKAKNDDHVDAASQAILYLNDVTDSKEEDTNVTKVIASLLLDRDLNR